MHFSAPGGLQLHFPAPGPCGIDSPCPKTPRVLFSAGLVGMAPKMKLAGVPKLKLAGVGVKMQLVGVNLGGVRGRGRAGGCPGLAWQGARPWYAHESRVMTVETPGPVIEEVFSDTASTCSSWSMVSQRQRSQCPPPPPPLATGQPAPAQPAQPGRPGLMDGGPGGPPTPTAHMLQ